jgi:hypothetical protein
MDKLRKINEELMKQLSKQRSDASSSSSKPDTPRMKRLDREMVSGKNPQDLAN